MLAKILCIVFFYAPFIEGKNIQPKAIQQQEKIVDIISKLWKKNDFLQAKKIVHQDMSQGKITKEIGHYVLAQQAVMEKDYDAWKKNILEIKNSSLLNNVKIVSEILESIPSQERSWLFNHLKENDIFKQPFQGSCPFYELNQRSMRGQLLLSALTSQTFNDSMSHAIINELYLGIPEAIDVESYQENKIFIQYKKSLLPADFSKRMNDLMLFGKNTEARKTYEVAIKESRNLSLKDRCELDYQNAKVERKMRNYKEARQKFQMIVATCPEEIKIKARYMDLMLASMASDVASRPQFDQFVADYPTHGFSDDVLFWAAKIEKSMGDYPSMFKTLDEIINRFPNGDMIEQALFLKAFEQVKLNKISDAMMVLKKLQSIAKPDSTAAHQSLYWLARLKVSKDIKMLKSVDKKTSLEVKKQLSQLINSKKPSAYSWLSWILTKELKQNSAPPLYKTHKPERLLAVKDNDIKNIEELIKAGLDEEARAFLMEKPVPRDDKKLGLWAQLFVEMKRPEIGYQRLIQCSGQANTLLAHYPGLYQAIAFPKPFEHEVMLATKAAKISPELVYSIMRRESGFLAHARSWAQARGLMQMMKKTADEQAKKISIILKSEDDLYDPKTNLLLGSTLIKNYWNQYDNLAVALAAYNGGPGLVRGWLKKNDNAPVDAFLETISVEETYRYLIEVLGNHFAYSTKERLTSLPKLGFYLVNKKSSD